MKLKLKKQKLVALTSDKMQNVNGGNEARSDRRGGDCKFSEKYGHTEDSDGEPDGCLPKFDCDC